jgi:hypothetical protein
LNNEIHASLVIVIVLTTVIPPFAIKWFHKNYAHRLVGVEDKIDSLKLTP